MRNKLLQHLAVYKRMPNPQRLHRVRAKGFGLVHVAPGSR